MSDPWLTIVTVVRDDPEGLRATMDSILTSRCPGVEVLIIDSSQDREDATRSWSHIAEVQWVPPTGIYPAMNLGLELARGTYIQFLNAGDVLFDAEVLTRVREIAAADALWMFGPVEIVGTTGAGTITPHWDYSVERRKLFSSGLFPQHQGTFMKTQALRDTGGFDTRYSIAADYAAFLKVSLMEDPVILDFVIATFHEGGQSTRNWRRALAEFHDARCQVFSPNGAQRILEQWNSCLHFGRVWTYRSIVEPLRARR